MAKDKQIQLPSLKSLQYRKEERNTTKQPNNKIIKGIASAIKKGRNCND